MSFLTWRHYVFGLLQFSKLFSNNTNSSVCEKLEGSQRIPLPQRPNHNQLTPASTAPSHVIVLENHNDNKHQVHHEGFSCEAMQL